MAKAPVKTRTAPNAILLDRTDKIPVIRIDGKDWPVPAFAPKQNEVIVPLLFEIWPKLNLIRQAGRDGIMDALGQVLDAAAIQNLYTCIFVALTRAHPDLTRDEFDGEFAIGILEAMEATQVIGQQTGIIRFTQGEGGAPGEA